MTEAILAKKYLRKMYNRLEFDALIDKVFLSKIEKSIIIDSFVNNKSCRDIANNCDLSISSIKRYKSIALCKIYSFLNEANLI